MTIAPDLQPYADRLYDELARDLHAGWLAALGPQRLRELAEQTTEAVVRWDDLPASAAALDDAYREGKMDGYDDGFESGRREGRLDGAEAERQRIAKALTAQNTGSGASS